MTTASASPELAAREPATPGPSGRSHVPALAGIALCLLLAVAQVAIGGYQLGVGNQAIQIAFLKRDANPGLYPTDLMVNQTLPLYPTYFFQWLALLLPVAGLSALYLALQIITSFTCLACVYWLSRSIFRSHIAALAAAALLVAGHLHALAGDTLYSQGFTHTFVALPAAIAALALAFRGRWVWAFCVAGALFNIHALTAAYALLMLSAALLADLGEMPPRRWLLRGLFAGSLGLLLASPTLALMMRNHQVFDARWLSLMRVRSADHSFPSTWWMPGDADVPRFILLTGLFVLSWSFSPLRRERALGGYRRGARMMLLMTAAVLGLFLAGYVFSEILPVPFFIRLQPFRASRLLMILMLVHIANGAVAAIRAGWLGSAPGTDGRTVNMALAVRILEIFAGITTLLTLAIPALLPWLPVTLALVTVTALAAGHLSWRQSIVAVAALLVAVLAWRQTDFPLWALRFNLWPQPAGDVSAAVRSLGLIALALAVIFAVALGIVRQRLVRVSLILLTLANGLLLAGVLFDHGRGAGFSGDNFGDVAAWARERTPTSALFLTPTGMGNFRIAAERSLVGDWRDGTQLYFSASFGPEWIDRATTLEPGLTLSDDGRRLIARGPANALASLSDEALIRLAGDYHADYILLPTPPKDHPRDLTIAFAGENFTAYEPQLKPRPVPSGVFDAQRWNDCENFMATTVQQNIEKYRKADVTLQITDAAGRPVQDLPIRMDQTQQAFTLGVSLGFFEPNNVIPDGDLKPDLVRPAELQKAPEVFNGSMIAFSSKWAYLEPQKGQYHWSDLDKYVDYATAHGMTLEFHHLSGVLPRWVEQMGGIAGQQGLNFPRPNAALQIEFTRHCLDTVARYADRIKYFQVVNEKYMMQYAPPVIRELKEKYPHDQFGISDCVKFWNGMPAFNDPRNADDQFKGADAIEWLARQGAKPDFFSVHGHYPLGLWADPRDMYKVFDYFQARGVRVHCSEEYLQLAGPIVGPIRTGFWTPSLQADYLARYVTVAFSHPDVDMVNLWGLPPNGWGASNSGLMDDRGNPRPAWDVLRKLFTETWRSHVAESLSLDGTLSARVFHGTYKVAITLPNGRIAQTTLVVPQTGAAKFSLKLEPEKGTLELVESH